MTDEDKEEQTSTTRFDERRKELINTTTETKKTELGVLKTHVEGIYHEEGIKKVLGDLEKQRKTFEKNIEVLRERIGPAPEMTNELEQLEENLRKINLMNYKKKQDEKMLKKDQEELKQNEENLKKIEKDLREIKTAIGSRLNLS